MFAALENSVDDNSKPNKKSATGATRRNASRKPKQTT
jgi:hypothetical protein